jgi:hypothetical protein
MHHSRLAGFIIDCRTEDLDSATHFWVQALGMKKAAGADEGYIRLDSDARDLHIEVQRVSHESRVHLDVETDDVEAEVRRLEGLGAARISNIKTWWVMEAPTGQRFCVVKRDAVAGSPGANTWK